MDDNRLKHYWCDSALLLDSEREYSKKYVNDNRQVVAKAFLGPTGQDVYMLVLRFGPKALSRYARDLSIEQCVPDAGETAWIVVDEVNKVMEVLLR